MTTGSACTQNINPELLGELSGVLSPETLSKIAKKLRRRSFSSGDADLDELFEAAGKKYNISPTLLKAIAKVESGFNIKLTSKTGAMGIMQLMPGTAKYLCIADPYDPEQNIHGGARYLKEQLIRFGGNVELALAAYSAGWAAVVNHRGLPPFKKTQAYVAKVLSYIGGSKMSANALTYDGFDMNGKKRSTSTIETSAVSGSASGDKLTFNYNEALAQMLFIKLIEKQMYSHRVKRTGSVPM